jgi:uncharacterized protein (DUF1015 family)
MAEIRPFRGLHYVDADLSTLLCPPFDVISPEEQRRFYQRSPFNAVRMEFGESQLDDTPSSNRYTRAVATLRDWLGRGILVRDGVAAVYVDDQQFTHEGRVLTRRNLFARVRLYDWEEGPIRPHERTLSGPKEDRIQLLRACRVNISPILSLYRDDDGSVKDAVDLACRSAPILATAEMNGERHSLRRLDDDATLAAIGRLAGGKTFYVIDGHHRYETALNYRNERRSRAGAWTGEEPENFVLIALVARDDRGVVVLPTHRLVRNAALPVDFVDLLRRDFEVKEVDASAGWQVMRSFLTAAAKYGVALGIAMAGRRLILRVRDPDEMARHMPPDCPASWRSLDAAVLEAAILRGVLGVDQQDAATAGSLTFTHDGDDALRLVDSGECEVAFLLSPAPVDQILSMADAGDRMPQKSTYFYPKLPAGLVMNSLD